MKLPRLLGVALASIALLVVVTAACSGGSASSPAPTAGGARDALIRGVFGVCTDGIHVGQSAPAAGVTCDDVCRVLGFAGCDYRAGQAGLEACAPANPERSGSCKDAFQENWSSQCRCTR